MPAEERVSHAVDTGGIGFPPRHAFNIAGLAVGLRDRSEKRCPTSELGKQAPRQIHAGIGMAAIEYEVATAKVCELSQSLVPVHDKDAPVRRARAILSLIHWCAKQQRLATVNGLQRIAANLREQRVAL